MFSARHFRKITRRKACARAVVVLAAASALLFARANTLKTSEGRSIRAVQASGEHYQRLRFDNDAPRCYLSIAVFAVSPLPESRSEVTPLPALFSPFYAGGDHYNRPPPTT